MALLRNFEQSLSGLFEGTFGRVFRTEVRPTEIARKLAREMEINKRVSLSRTYAPTDYLVYLSPEDRARYEGVEQSIAEELGAYLLEHARRERLVLVRRPLVEFRTDRRLRLGEFGIEARTAPISAEEAPARDGSDGAHQATGRDHASDGRSRPEPGPPPTAPADPELGARYDEGPYEDDPDEAPAPPGPAVPLGTDDLGGAPRGRIDAIEPEGDDYADPYANDFASDPDSGDFGWVDAPPSHREPDEPDERPAAARDDRAARDDAEGTYEADYADVPDEFDHADADARRAEPPAAPGRGPDWLDPVEDWAPQAAEPAPEPDSDPEPPAPSRQVEPHAPAAPAASVPAPDPLAGAPWIDPTLRRQGRPQFAPPVVPPTPVPAAAPPKRVTPRVPDTVLLIDGTPHELTGDRVVLGRSRTADIVVSDASISRQHLELRRDDRGWYAVDLGSTNGSQIGGEMITEPRRLQAGQRIKLGHADAIIEVR